MWCKMAGLPPVFEHEYPARAPGSESLGSTASAVLGSLAANMAANGHHHGHHKVRVNGFDDVPRPFFIGVAGGTASGKVSDHDWGFGVITDLWCFSRLLCLVSLTVVYTWLPYMLSKANVFHIPKKCDNFSHAM